MLSIFNPLYLLAPPILVLISLPLAGFAVLTTTFALTTLLIRVSIVYVELGLALIRSYLFASEIKPSPRVRTQPPTNLPPHRRRRSSVLSTSSSQDFGQSPIKNAYVTKSDSFASLLGAGAQGPGRDFEGVGGWRDAAVDPAEEALWISMNSRLELPAVAPERQRRHQRSLTGGSQRWSGVWSPESMRMSPVQSRARTPSVTDLRMSEGADEYFGLQPHGRQSSEVVAMKTGKGEGRRKSLSGGNEEKRRSYTSQDGEQRRKSSSSSSTSSQSSARASRVTVKETSFSR